MKVCLDWLKDYLDFEFETCEMLSNLTMAGIEIESYEKYKPDFEGVIFASIKGISKHLQAEKLLLCDVYDGENTIRVVCGANNFKVGDVVAFAPNGSKVSGRIIEKAKIRGELSNGMLCSEKELGIGFDNSGIMIFENNYEVGRKLDEVLSLNDEIIEFGITPNRGDCLSVIGIAREIAASFGKQISYPEINEESNFGSDFKVEITDEKLCSYYGGAIIENVKVGISPFKLRYRLFHSGIRALNNIVDITNYILIELGQPMHAFDMDKLTGNKIIVRTALEAEEIVTLDGINRKLGSHNLVIADDSGPIALAGVMGGEKTSVTNETVRIFFESACFYPSSIRLTSRKLNLSSDSSYRFERGIDPFIIPLSLKIACGMSSKFAESKILKTDINIEKISIPGRKIQFDAKRCNKLLGTDLSADEIDECLSKIEIHNVEGNNYEVPSYRNDLLKEVDLIEEVARMYGYDNIPLNKEVVEMNFEPHSPGFKNTRSMKKFLIGLGLCECINYSFVSPKDIISISDFIKRPEQTLNLQNPLSREQSVMRTSLFSGLVKNYVNSKNYNASNIRLFETGAVYKGDYEKEDEEILGDEHLGVLLGGGIPASFISENERVFDFFDIKGVIEKILSSLKISYELSDINCEFFTTAVDVSNNGNVLGVLGEVSKDAAKKFGVKETVYYAELDLMKLMMYSKKSICYKKLNRFPIVKEDMSFIVDNKITHKAISDVINEMKIHQVEKVEVFDIFKGKNIPEDKKSVAYSITYRDNEKTLKTEDVNGLHEKIKNKLREKINAEYR